MLAPTLEEIVLASVYILLLLVSMGYAVYRRWYRRLHPPAPTATVREEVQRFRKNPQDFVPLYHPQMDAQAVAAEVDRVLVRLEEVARSGHDEAILLLDPQTNPAAQDAARVAAEMLSRFGYRCSVWRGSDQHTLRIAWDAASRL